MGPPSLIPLLRLKHRRVLQPVLTQPLQEVGCAPQPQVLTYRLWGDCDWEDLALFPAHLPIRGSIPVILKGFESCGKGIRDQE